MNRIFKYCLIVLATSCSSTSSRVHSFYAGDEGTQYFIKPLMFKSKETKEICTADFTFRDRPKDQLMNANFSFISAKRIISASFIALISQAYKDTFQFKIENQIYAEKKKGNYEVRFASSANKRAINCLLKSEKLLFYVKTNEGDLFFTPDNQTVKSIKLINQRVILQ